MLTQIAAGVWTHQSPLIQNNTIVVQGASGVLLIDPGITVAEIECLVSDLGQPVVAAFSTHPDWDHALWHPVLGDAPRYGTPAAAAFLSMRGGWGKGLVLGVVGLWMASLIRTPRLQGASQGKPRPGPPTTTALGLAEARSILGVAPEATRGDIEEAYRRLMRRAHPDQGGTTGLAAQLNAARDRLLRG